MNTTKFQVEREPVYQSWVPPEIFVEGGGGKKVANRPPHGRKDPPPPPMMPKYDCFQISSGARASLPNRHNRSCTFMQKIYH